MKKYMLGIVATVSLIVCNAALADLVQNVTIGNAKALALGNAVTADPPGIDSIHFNPAGLALLDKRQYQIKVLAIPHLSFETELRRSDWGEQILADIGLEEEIPAYVSEDVEGAMVYVPFRGLRNVPVIIGAFLGGLHTNLLAVMLRLLMPCICLLPGGINPFLILRLVILQLIKQCPRAALRT